MRWMSPVLSLTIVTFGTSRQMRTINSGDMSIPLVAGLLYSMIGIPTASPMRATWRTISSSLSFQYDTGKTITASAPCFSAKRARRMAPAVVRSEIPTTVGTRLATAASEVAATASHSPSCR